MSTTPAVRGPAQTAIAKISSDEAREQLRAALPPSVSLDRFTRATATALIQNPSLAGSDEAALFQAIVKCAQDGLFPDGREAALVLYHGKAQYLPMIAGVRKIAAEYGWTIKTTVVYANEEFSVEGGTEDRITHRHVRPGEDRGDLVAAYAVAYHRDGRHSITEVMYEPDIAKAKAVAQTDRIWKQWPAQMWEKTVGHRIAKKLPLDPQDAVRLNRVIEAADLAQGEAAQMLYGPAAGNGAVATEASPGAPTPTVTGSLTEPGDGRRQAGAAEEAPGSPGADSAAAPVPGDLEFVEGEIEAEFGADVDDVTDADTAAAADAAKLIVAIDPAEAWVNGLTLEQVLARGDEAVVFFRWALGLNKGRSKNKDAALIAAATAFAKVHLPFLHDELVGGAS